MYHQSVSRPLIYLLRHQCISVLIRSDFPLSSVLDKQLAFAELLCIKSIIVLNKTDLDKEQSFKTIKNVYEDIGYTVIETEAKTQKGVVELIKQLKDNINAFAMTLLKNIM